MLHKRGSHIKVRNLLDTLQIYTVKLQWKRDTCKKCALQYLPYTVQCRSYRKKPVKQLYNYSTVLGAAIKCKPYSEITVESGTHLKTVYICSVLWHTQLIVCAVKY